jgi:hypothetical protein
MRSRILLGVGIVTAIAVVTTALFFEHLVIMVMDPGVPFDANAAPRAPDYENPDAWSAVPARDDAADAALPELPARNQATAPVDVFYVHPTSYIGGSWNGPIDDPALNAATDKVATRIQASAFNACCAIYAPRYRQANGTAFTRPTPDSQLALDLAYRDVREAFRLFLDKYSHGRPFILASHSQGSVLARRLLREEITGSRRHRLVVAYLIGAPLTEQALLREAPDIHVCTAETQTGCVVSWNARAPGFESGKLEFQDAFGAPTEARVCVNPLTWRDDGAPAGAALNEGAVFLETEQPSLMPGFASAQCSGGTLVVSEIGKPPRDFMSRLLDHALGAGNYHPIEYQIFFVNLRRNANARVAAYLQRGAALQITE